ncbi:uncharacterized mitochondrial protein AtMg00810-like [Lycium barbarum]|uniref:uncharacterized mitochondrial protein AtMg00810-like n=1 Tax=Lycium barbarum TaxID=112863 RepID=UPI00293EBF79|nr:uncharacterized mitochondrial protein AtMg00810-like [Lycium barbarum]
MSQSSYAEDILDRAGMSQCKPCPTPVDTKGKLSATSSAPYEDPTKYRRLILSMVENVIISSKPDMPKGEWQDMVPVNDIIKGLMFDGVPDILPIVGGAH